MWLFTGLAVYFWPYVVGAAAVFAVIVLARRAVRGWRAAATGERRRRDSIAARADQQHGWILNNDDRGLYGDYPPAA